MFGKAEAELMDDIYDALYKYEEKDNMHDTTRSDELVDGFDDMLHNDPDFRDAVIQTATARQDAIMSDREAAAFMLMWLFA